MDIWNKVGDKMQTITRIEEDTYIMKNYEFLFKAGYFAVYFMINLLNTFSMIFLNTSYKYGYVILIFSSLLLFLLKKYVFNLHASVLYFSKSSDFINLVEFVGKAKILPPKILLFFRFLVSSKK